MNHGHPLKIIEQMKSEQAKCFTDDDIVQNVNFETNWTRHVT
jgi:hypothetical protein